MLLLLLLLLLLLISSVLLFVCLPAHKLWNFFSIFDAFGYSVPFQFWSAKQTFVPLIHAFKMCHFHTNYNCIYPFNSPPLLILSWHALMIPWHLYFSYQTEIVSCPMPFWYEIHSEEATKQLVRRTNINSTLNHSLITFHFHEKCMLYKRNE